MGERLAGGDGTVGSDLGEVLGLRGSPGAGDPVGGNVGGGEAGKSFGGGSAIGGVAGGLGGALAALRGGKRETKVVAAAGVGALVVLAIVTVAATAGDGGDGSAPDPLAPPGPMDTKVPLPATTVLPGRPSPSSTVDPGVGWAAGGGGS